MHTYFVADIDIWNKWQVTILFASLLFLRVYIRDLQPCSWRAIILQISVPTLLQPCLGLELKSVGRSSPGAGLKTPGRPMWNAGLTIEHIHNGESIKTVSLSVTYTHTHTHTHTHTRRNERFNNTKYTARMLTHTHTHTHTHTLTLLQI